MGATLEIVLVRAGHFEHNTMIISVDVGNSVNEGLRVRLLEALHEKLVSLHALSSIAN